AAKGRILRHLPCDALAIDEIEDPVTAADHCLLISAQVIRETNAGSKILFRIDQASGVRNAVLSGDFDRSGYRIKVGHPVVFFRWPGEKVIAQAQIEGQTIAHAIVILPVETIFPAASVEHGACGADLIVVYPANQQVRLLKAGGLWVVCVCLEETLARDRIKKVDLALDQIYAELERMAPLHNRDVVRDLVGIFRDELIAILSS